MNGLNLLLKITTGLSIFLFSTQNWASCTTKNPKEHSFKLPSTAITVSHNQTPGPIGSVISTSAGSAASVTCTGGGIQMLKFETPMVQSEYNAEVYKTDIPGIGVKVWNDWANDGWPGAQNITLSNMLQYWYDWHGGKSNSNFITNVKLQFYVIGPVTAGTVSLKTPTVGAYSNTSVSETGAVRYAVLNITGSFEIKIRACKTPDIKVDLGKHSRSDFANLNATSAATPFTFAINDCDPKMNSVHYTFKPAPGITVGGTGANQHITLDSSSTARGFGIQVLYDSGAGNTLVPLNTKTKFTGYSTSATTTRSYTIPMKARFIRTASNAADVSGGSASSAIEFTMSYE